MQRSEVTSRLLSAPFRVASALTVEPALRAARAVAGGKNPFPQSIAGSDSPGGAVMRWIRQQLGETVKGKR